MARIRNSEWEDDCELKDDLQKYVSKNLKREEILDFVKRDYPNYSWSLGTLSRRLKHFNIKYVNHAITVEAVETAVRQELDGPGQLLGYCALHKVIREKHELAIPRQLVYDVMTNVDPEALEGRRVDKRKRPRGPTGTFTSMVGKIKYYNGLSNG
jgi:hypothetical protein